MQDLQDVRNVNQLLAVTMLAKMEVFVYQWVTQFNASAQLVSRDVVVKLISMNVHHSPVIMVEFVRTSHKDTSASVHPATRD
jgi:hypothetical protein